MGFLERKFMKGVKDYRRIKEKIEKETEKENPFLKGVREYRKIKREMIHEV